MSSQMETIFGTHYKCYMVVRLGFWVQRKRKFGIFEIYCFRRCSRYELSLILRTTEDRHAWRTTANEPKD